jgi:uncharacterized protein (TIGR00369 family)
LTAEANRTRLAPRLALRTRGFFRRGRHSAAAWPNVGLSGGGAANLVRQATMSNLKPRPFTIDELHAYLAEIFPQVWKSGDLRIEDLAPMAATVRLVHHPRHLRYGGTIAGPAMFALCDVALYVAILGEVGRRVAHAVTTNVSINFLLKPAPADLIGKARLIKLGKRLVVGEVELYSEGASGMVAHATGTYSIPSHGESEVS